jgi:hypothetical protein
MTESERKAMEWLEHVIRVGGYRPGSAPATIKSMLAQPRLPGRLPEEAKAAMRAAFDDAYTNYDFIGAIYDALCAHLTAPRTKEVEVWRVEFARHGEPQCLQYLDVGAAELNAASFRHQNHLSCIRVTGPHKQMVPA